MAERMEWRYSYRLLKLLQKRMLWLEKEKERKVRKGNKKRFFCLLLIFKEDSRVLEYWLLSCAFGTDGQSLL